jgi:hypothetical protein
MPDPANYLAIIPLVGKCIVETPSYIRLELETATEARTPHRNSVMQQLRKIVGDNAQFARTASIALNGEEEIIIRLTLAGAKPTATARP